MKKNKELQRYIKKTQRLGFSVKEITDALLEYGWTKKQIKEGFESSSKKNIFLKNTGLIIKTSTMFALKCKNILKFTFIGNSRNAKKSRSLVKKENLLPAKKEDFSIIKTNKLEIKKKEVKKVPEIKPNKNTKIASVKKNKHKEEGILKKEPGFLWDKIHLSWHYLLKVPIGIKSLFKKKKSTELREIKGSLPIQYTKNSSLSVVDSMSENKIDRAKDKKHILKEKTRTHKKKEVHQKHLSKKRAFEKNNLKSVKKEKKKKSSFGDNIIVRIVLYIPKFILRVFYEIGQILKGDAVFIKLSARSLAKKSKKEIGVVEKEPGFLWDKIHLFWHYFVELLERFIKFTESVVSLLIRLIMLPFAILNIIYLNIKGGKNKLKFTGVKRTLFSKGKEYTVKDISEGSFPEKISFLDVLRLAKRMFETRRLRTFLTILGMGVGIGAILFLVSLGYGLQNVLFERITSEDALLIVDAYPPAEEVGIEITDEMIKEIESINDVDKVGRMTTMSGGVSMNSISVVAKINVLDENFRDMSPERFIEGDFSNEGVVVSAATATLLGFGDDPKKAIGSSVSMFILVPNEEKNNFVNTYSVKEEYKITGVIEDFSESFAYFPLEKIQGVALPSFSQLKVKTFNADLVVNIKDEVITFGLQVAALSDTLDQAKKMFGIARIVLGVFGIITLGVSAIGMLNTMTIALLERTQEVGIMKSIGASNLDVWKLFLAESVIMGFLGGVGGIIIGYSASELFNYGINLLAKTFGGQALDLFQQPLWFVMTIVVFSAVIGLLTGFMPARRAAKLDPLLALKS